MTEWIRYEEPSWYELYDHGSQFTDGQRLVVSWLQDNGTYCPPFVVYYNAEENSFFVSGDRKMTPMHFDIYLEDFDLCCEIPEFPKNEGKC